MLLTGLVKPVVDPFSVAVFVALRNAQPRTLTQLADATRLSRPTVLEGVKGLEDRGWIERLDPDGKERKAGRPAIRFRLRGEDGIVAGVDVGVHKLLVILLNLHNEIVGEHRVQFEGSMTGAGRVEAVGSAIDEAMRLFAPSSRLLAVGAGVPGIVDRLGRISVARAIPELDGIELGARLQQQLGCPVFIENDAHAATLGEFSYGAGRGTSDLIYLVAGYRTAAGMIIGGTLHRGRTGAAGMVGEMNILRWLGATERLMATDVSDDIAPVAAADVFRAAEMGDQSAAAAIAQYADDLATGLSALALAVDPELVVIGGGISLAGPPFAQQLRERLGVHARLIRPRVEISELGDRAAALGGVRLALDHVETAVFDLTNLPEF
ncbi:ROK family protein [Leifsonia aquatica]|uniref:ROK family protein n=1 Tax=Leifsonia aquatica TaxID=144185 RepID=UPI0028AC06F7|nr:ROK family transcriptional regulator [Leifsonia aquatica]